MPRSLPEPVRLLAAADPVAAFGALADDALIALPTSGTTGVRREIVRTAGSWRSAFPALGELTGFTATSRLWLPGPLAATMNLYAAVHAAWAGAQPASSEATATHLHLTPSVLRHLLDEVSHRHEPELVLTGRTLVVAGDTLVPSLRHAAEQAGATVHHYYGAAELSFVAWGSDRDDLRPFPGVEVQVRDGEIWVHSSGIARGYAGTPGALRTDGAFATVGDRGRITADGRLEVYGRPDAILTGGATVLVADVEDTLNRHARGFVAVLGLPHPRLGQIVAAVLTDAADRQRVAGLELGTARPRRWFLRPELPLTPAGKLDRRALASDLQQSEHR